MGKERVFQICGSNITPQRGKEDNIQIIQSNSLNSKNAKKKKVPEMMSLNIYLNISSDKKLIS